MKMSDLFEMPVVNKGRIRVYVTAVLDDVDCSDAEKAAAHAINCHDELVAMLVQLQTEGGLGVARHRQIDRLLTKARGEA